AVIKHKLARIEVEVISRPNRVLKPVKPLFPPKPVSLRKNNTAAAKVMAWVMIEKYTPLIFERKAKYTKIKAISPGTRITKVSDHKICSVPTQYHGSSVQLKKRMKSGKPSPADSRIRYIPKA